jgi:hypothetical protein
VWVYPNQANSQEVGSEHRKAIPIATNKASGLSARINIIKAESLFVKGDKCVLNGWFALWEDMNRLGVKAQPYAKAYRENEARKTDHSARSVETYLGAVNRAVKKYGSLSKMMEAYEAWVKAERYTYGEITNFIKFAPSGQRAQSVPEKVEPATAVTLTRPEADKRLNAFPKALRDEIIKALGIK